MEFKYDVFWVNLAQGVLVLIVPVRQWRNVAQLRFRAFEVVAFGVTPMEPELHWVDWRPTLAEIAQNGYSLRNYGILATR